MNENGTTTNLTYPWILTLGADFFLGCALMEVTQAICNGTSSSDQLDRFKKKYAPLLSSCDGAGSSAPIHDLCKYVIAQSSMTQMMWQANNNESWKAYFVQIGGETMEDYFNQTVYPSAIGFGRYLIISAHDFDHFAFGSDAAIAYTVAHGTAFNQAIVASSRGNIADLNAAYAMNVLADHYLSGMFSTGHLRAPRQALHYNYALYTGNFLTKYMHDEDSAFGLNVANRQVEGLWRQAVLRYRQRH